MEFRRIVVSTDFTENSLPALEAAFGLTSEATDKLYIAHVVEIPAVSAPPMASVVPPVDQLYKAAKERLEGLIPENFKHEVAIETVVLTGTPSSAISDFAREKDADIIVVGTHGRKGLARVLMGSTAEALLRESPCQILVVKPKAPAKEPDAEHMESGEPAR